MTDEQGSKKKTFFNLFGKFDFQKRLQKLCFREFSVVQQMALQPIYYRSQETKQILSQ